LLVALIFVTGSGADEAIAVPGHARPSTTLRTHDRNVIRNTSQVLRLGRAGYLGIADTSIRARIGPLRVDVGNWDLLVYRFNNRGMVDRRFGHDGRTDRVRVGRPGDFWDFAAPQLWPRGFFIAGWLRDESTMQPPAYAVIAFRHDGSLDRKFAGDGVLIRRSSPRSTERERLIDAQPGPANPLVVCGRLQTKSAALESAYLRMFTTDGRSGSTSEGPARIVIPPAAGYTNRHCQSLVIGADGGIFVLGADSNSRYTSRRYPFVRRYNPDGTQDLSFGDNGESRPRYTDGSTESTEFVPVSVSLDSAGNLIVLGNSDGRTVVTKLDSRGAAQKSFGTDGSTVFNQFEARQIKEDHDGMLVVSGDYWTRVEDGVVDEINRPAIGRLTSNGRWDPAFATRGWRRFAHKGGGFFSLFLGNDRAYVSGWTGLRAGSEPNFRRPARAIAIAEIDLR
jgi:uncharacterized delta-60 repeat protein